MNPTNRTKKDPQRPGPKFDRSFRTTSEDDPGSFCTWLGESPDRRVETISSVFTAETLYADFVGRVAPDRLVHTEYILDPRREAAVQMVAYRGQLMRIHPGCSIKQYALVLADGRLPSVDDPQTGFTLGARTIYLRDCDPEELLAHPSLGALAVLAAGDMQTRAQSLKKAIRGVQKLPENRRIRLLDAMYVLATIRLQPSAIDEINKQLDTEDGMTIESVTAFYRQTEMGQAVHNQGLEQGSARTLTALLRARFGDRTEIPTIAEHLVQILDDDAGIRVVTEAESLDDLADWLSPPGPAR